MYIWIQHATPLPFQAANSRFPLTKLPEREKTGTIPAPAMNSFFLSSRMVTCV